MDHNYIAAILFFLPAGVANALPPVLSKLPFLKHWNTPIDFGKTFRGKRITGDNKSWRALILCSILAGFVAVAVSHVVPETIVNKHIFLTGLLLGGGALIGDAFESFVKRQKGIKPGQTWFPWDQTDYIAGGLLFVLPIAPLPLWAIITIVVAYFPLHLIFAYVGYRLGLKSSPI